MLPRVRGVVVTPVTISPLDVVLTTAGAGVVVWDTTMPTRKEISYASHLVLCLRLLTSVVSATLKQTLAQYKNTASFKLTCSWRAVNVAVNRDN